MNANADMFEVFRRLAGNPEDCYAVERGNVIERWAGAYPGRIMDCPNPKDVRVIPWYRVRRTTMLLTEYNVRIIHKTTVLDRIKHLVFG